MFHIFSLPTCKVLETIDSLPDFELLQLYVVFATLKHTPNPLLCTLIYPHTFTVRTGYMHAFTHARLHTYIHTRAHAIRTGYEHARVQTPTHLRRRTHSDATPSVHVNAYKEEGADTHRFTMRRLLSKPLGITWRVSTKAQVEANGKNRGK